MVLDDGRASYREMSFPIVSRLRDCSELCCNASGIVAVGSKCLECLVPVGAVPKQEIGRMGKGACVGARKIQESGEAQEN